MARSYKSALPTWSTYTPHVGPMGVQPAINQENCWRERAPAWQHPGDDRWRAQPRTDACGQSPTWSTGTGMVPYARRCSTPPILNALQQASASSVRSPTRQWAEPMQEAMERQAPERHRHRGGEHEPTRVGQTQVRAAPYRTAPTVNPSRRVHGRTPLVSVAVTAGAAGCLAEGRRARRVALLDQLSDHRQVDVQIRKDSSNHGRRQQGLHRDSLPPEKRLQQRPIDEPYQGFEPFAPCRLLDERGLRRRRSGRTLLIDPAPQGRRLR